MSFTVSDFDDLKRLLGEHPEWRVELRRLLLTDDMEALPGIVRELAEAQRRAEARLEGVEDRLTRTEQVLEQLVATQREMAEHLMTLPPASRVNTLMMMRAMRPRVTDEIRELADRLNEHGARDDLMESRRAFAEKRPPQFKGWDNPEDRARTPTLESIRRERVGERI